MNEKRKKIRYKWLKNLIEIDLKKHKENRGKV